MGKTKVTQNQFDALVSFAYNRGVGGLEKSTLLRMIKANSNDPRIRAEFLSDINVKVKGRKGRNNGLINRRKKERDLYFSR